MFRKSGFAWQKSVVFSTDYLGRAIGCLLPMCNRHMHNVQIVAPYMDIAKRTAYSGWCNVNWGVLRFFGVPHRNQQRGSIWT